MASVCRWDLLKGVITNQIERDNELPDELQFAFTPSLLTAARGN